MVLNWLKREGAREASVLRAGFVVTAVVVLAGCGSISPDSSLGAAQLRFVQVSPGAPDMDFYVNGGGAAYNLGFGSFTSYLPVSPGAASLSVTKAGGGQTVVTAQSALSGGHQYTAIVSHGLGNLQERVYPDEGIPAPPNQIAVRVLNEVDGAAAVSVYVVPAGSTAGAPAAVFSVNGGAASGYVSLPATGSYNVTATVAEGTLSVPVANVTVKAISGAVRTLVFAGNAPSAGRGVVAFVLEDADAP